ncbi:hypothetical protein EOM82_02730 [bacterium]|nr:hypothetical protein [bacterium]
MKKFLIAVLGILGFPALLGYLAYKSYDMIMGGLSYGVFVFVGLIVTALFGLIYLFVCLGMRNSAKKKNKKNLYRQTFVAMILCFCLLGGFWIALDVALPDFLADATSNTIYYEDLADDYYARSQVNEALLNEYIKRNVINGNLTNLKLEEYQKQGIKNEEVANMLEIQFESIDKAGFVTFAGPNIDLALGDRMTIAVLVHLLLDERDVPEKEYYLYNASTKKIEKTPVNWNVLDMLGTPMAVANLGSLGDNPAISALLGSVGVPLLNNMLVAKVTEDLTSSPIYLGIVDGDVLLIPSNEKRGVLDYQSMAWLDSNGLIYAIVMLFSTRKLFLIWAAWLVLNNLLIGLLRGMGKELRSKAQKENGTEKRSTAFPYSYVSVNSPADYDSLDMMKLRDRFIQDCKDGVAREYLPYELKK